MLVISLCQIDIKYIIIGKLKLDIRFYAWRRYNTNFIFFTCLYFPLKKTLFLLRKSRLKREREMNSKGRISRFNFLLLQLHLCFDYLYAMRNSQKFCVQFRQKKYASATNLKYVSMIKSRQHDAKLEPTILAPLIRIIMMPLKGISIIIFLAFSCRRLKKFFRSNVKQLCF